MTLYEMLAGCLPWGDELDLVGVLMRKQNAEIPPPSDFYPDIPVGVVAVVMSALSPERGARQASVEELRRVLDGAGKTPLAPPGPIRTLVERAPAPTPAARPAPRPSPPAATFKPTAVEVAPHKWRPVRKPVDKQGWFRCCVKWCIAESRYKGRPCNNLCKNPDWGYRADVVKVCGPWPK